MRILGVDPGLAVTGYGLIEAGSVGSLKLIEAGVIRTGTKENLTERLCKIYSCIDALITEYKPDGLILEKLYSHYKHPATAIFMGHARGVICLACGLKNIKLINYSALRIKKAITGRGDSSKEQIQHVVTEILKLKKAPEPVDVTDALAMAIAHANIEFKQFNVKG